MLAASAVDGIAVGLCAAVLILAVSNVALFVLLWKTRARVEVLQNFMVRLVETGAGSAGSVNAPSSHVSASVAEKLRALGKSAVVLNPMRLSMGESKSRLRLSDAAKTIALFGEEGAADAGPAPGVVSPKQPQQEVVIPVVNDKGTTNPLSSAQAGKPSLQIVVDAKAISSASLGTSGSPGSNGPLTPRIARPVNLGSPLDAVRIMPVVVAASPSPPAAVLGSTPVLAAVESPSQASAVQMAGSLKMFSNVRDVPLVMAPSAREKKLMPSSSYRQLRDSGKGAVGAGTSTSTTSAGVFVTSGSGGGGGGKPGLPRQSSFMHHAGFTDSGPNTPEEQLAFDGAGALPPPLPGVMPPQLPAPLTSSSSGGVAPLPPSSGAVATGNEDVEALSTPKLLYRRQNSFVIHSTTSLMHHLQQAQPQPGAGQVTIPPPAPSEPLSAHASPRSLRRELNPAAVPSSSPGGVVTPAQKRTEYQATRRKSMLDVPSRRMLLVDPTGLGVSTSPQKPSMLSPARGSSRSLTLGEFVPPPPPPPPSVLQPAVPPVSLLQPQQRTPKFKPSLDAIESASKLLISQNDL